MLEEKNSNVVGNSDKPRLRNVFRAPQSRACLTFILHHPLLLQLPYTMHLATASLNKVLCKASCNYKFGAQ
jgi:hypothetical protein